MVATGRTRPTFGGAFPQPRRVGRYELLLELGAGGMAVVYLARARAMAGFERIVALKCCHPHLRGNHEFATMFLDEARLAAKLHHPNVVATVDLGEDDALYLVMEYVEGEPLLALLRAAAHRGETAPPGVVLRIMVDALAGLHAAHELRDTDGEPLRLVHRDLSPQNILVGVDGVARLTDFGIAKAERRATVTRTSEVKGKASYMAPEQVSGGEVTRRADVFAAGIVLWEALTGQRLFRADNDAAAVHAVLHREVPAASSLEPSLPATLDAVLFKALARAPEERYATAAEFAEALEGCGVPVATTRAASACMLELCGAAIERRREALRALDAGEAPPAYARVPDEETATSVPSPTSGALAVGASVALPAPSRARRWAPAAGLALAATLAWVALRPGAPPSPAAHAVASPAVAPPTPSSPPAAATTPVAPVALPSPPSAPPSVSPSPAPLAPPAAVERARTHRAGRRARPAGAAATGVFNPGAI